MTEKLKRRAFLAGLSATATLSLPRPAIAKNRPKVVVIGGGFGGASAAMHLRKIAPNIEVTLIEANPVYYSCPMSNLSLAGPMEIPWPFSDYDGVSRSGVNVIIDRATKIDGVKKTVQLAQGSEVNYDRLIVSPGIDFRWDVIEGYDEAAAEIMPHAWKAGRQTRILQQQLGNMKVGTNYTGTIIISVPPAPYRCPPGPYERASLIAEGLTHPAYNYKVLILDSQDEFPKQDLFEKHWQAPSLLSNVIERVPGSDSGQVVRVDPGTKTVFTEFDEFRGDVVNIIPPQWAGRIARENDLADASGWCPINGLTFESTRVPDVHVIGDATIAAPMPKSAFAANQQAKICVHQIVRSFNNRAPTPTKLLNTCYSHIEHNQAFSVTGVYENASGVIKSVPGAGGTSPINQTTHEAYAEAKHAMDWFMTLQKEAFG